MCEVSNNLANAYLQSTRAVLQAGRQLRNVLDKDRATLDFAVSGLERAAQLQDNGGSDYHAFMFTALQAAPKADVAVTEKVTQDALASVLTDMHVANVLIAAGQTLGETGKAAHPNVLDGAILSLENAANIEERSLRRAPAAAAESGRLGFVGEVLTTKVPE